MQKNDAKLTVEIAKHIGLEFLLDKTNQNKRKGATNINACLNGVRIKYKPITMGNSFTIRSHEVKDVINIEDGYYSKIEKVVHDKSLAKAIFDIIETNRSKDEECGILKIR